MLIGGLQRMTLIDYPGKIACAVFTVGCNFRCHFCHNPELVERVAAGFSPRQDERSLKAAATSFLVIGEEEFFEFLKSRQGLLDAVCVTGGEPTLHPGLPEFFRKIKALGFLLKLDTNGTNPEMLEALIAEKLIDYVAMDIKTKIKTSAESEARQGRQMSDVKTYEEVVGVKVNTESVKKSIKIIMNSGLDYEFRTTVVPGLHSEADIVSLAGEIRGAKKYFLQQFRPGNKILSPEFRSAKAYSIEFLQELREKIKENFEICEVRE